jgi:hypothetical protein
MVVVSVEEVVVMAMVKVGEDTKVTGLSTTSIIKMTRQDSIAHLTTIITAIATLEVVEAVDMVRTQEEDTNLTTNITLTDATITTNATTGHHMEKTSPKDSVMKIQTTSSVGKNLTVHHSEVETAAPSVVE